MNIDHDRDWQSGLEDNIWGYSITIHYPFPTFMTNQDIGLFYIYDYAPIDKYAASSAM